MRRGHVYWVSFDPVVGSEPNKTRPAVIVSNDALNRASEQLGRGLVTVAPISGNVDHVRAFQVLVPAGAAGLVKASKVQAEQVRALSIERLQQPLGTLPADLMVDVDAALRLQLNL